MKHAFLILAHREAEQVKLLIDEIISNDDCDVHVHIDSKNEALFKVIVDYYAGNDRVFYLQERVSVYWADFSLIEATLRLLNEAKRYGYQYYSLVSGQDYFIKPVADFNHFLQDHHGKEFIEYKPRNNSWRVRLTHRHTASPLFRKSKLFRYYALFLSLISSKTKKALAPYKIYFGSQWFTISDNAVKYIFDFLQKQPNFLKEFETSTCGDEHFFQTILLNSDFRHKIYPDNLRFIKFDNRVNSPDVLTLDNYRELIESSRFIARKFDIQVDAEIITKLKAFIER
jgi:hypothetical protein